MTACRPLARYCSSVWRALPLGLASLLLAGCAPWSQGNPANTRPSLEFDARHYELRQIEVNGQTLAVRAYENIVYVARPADARYERMNLYVPEAYFKGGSVGGFTARTAPIFLPNEVGGYMPAEPARLGGRQGPGEPPGAPPPGAPMAGPGAPPPGMERPNTLAVALSQGFVVAAPGARGRTQAQGKAPAAIVDLKAAVRYLRYNDERMPGDAERIISNGTSAGGALSALLGASGNSVDYQPWLDELGAAPGRDDVFAVSAYCPITNLEHADSAYEWLFAGLNDYQKIEISMLDYKVQRKPVAGTLTPEQIRLSRELKAAFPAYLNSLQLRGPEGQVLSLDSQGQGAFRQYLSSLLVASAQQALDQGQKLSGMSWLTLRDGRVVDLNLEGYLAYAGRMKTPPAFDALDLGSGENQLFGNARVDQQHFTDFGMAHNTSPGATRADPQQVALMNPMHYIGRAGVRTSAHWRIRQGTKDRDTSLAVPVILASALRQQGASVDLALPWDRPHSGDYDLDQLFAWARQISLSR
ncbi:MAG: alpha/beta hydrolase [Curvibacter sp.]|nr:MAG: alpha/beta hydrolase [Curvibacter sp.]